MRTSKNSMGGGSKTIDILTGGFPCQPFSKAGKQRGKEDDRDLWPEMFRVIKKAKPTWIIGENVAQFVNMELERSLSDLESQGYEVCPFIIPACSVNAPHRRDRVWIVAHSNGKRWNVVDKKQEKKTVPINTESFKRWKHFEDNLRLDFIGVLTTKGRRIKRNDYGLSKGMDRLKAVGNAIVPQVAIEIMKAIKQI